MRTNAKKTEFPTADVATFQQHDLLEPEVA